MKIKKLDLKNHNPYMDICYLECIVMDNGEVINGSLGRLGFVGKKDGRIELNHLYTEDKED